MAQPSPTSLFNIIHNVVDACAFANLLIGNLLFPVDSEDSTKTTSLETSEPALHLLIGSPSVRGVHNRTGVELTGRELGLCRTLVGKDAVKGLTVEETKSNKTKQHKQNKTNKNRNVIRL